MDRLESMSILVAAVEAGSLSAAARKLDAPLTSVSRKVSDLETHLGARLLNRSSRRLTLTEAGQAYVLACRRILEEVGEAERAVSGEYHAPKGELVVTAPIVFGRLHVLPVATAFLAAYPDVDLKLRLSDHVANLLEEPVDVAVRIGALPDSSLVASRLGEIRRVVCASPAYLAARGTPLTPAELTGHDGVTYEGLGSPTAWTFPVDRAQIAVPIHSRLTVNTAEAAIDAAAAALGLTRVLCYQIAAHLQTGALNLVLEAFEPPAWPVNLVFAGGRRQAQKVRAFLDFAGPRLRARLPQGPSPRP